MNTQGPSFKAIRLEPHIIQGMMLKTLKYKKVFFNWHIHPCSLAVLHRNSCSHLRCIVSGLTYINHKIVLKVWKTKSTNFLTYFVFLWLDLFSFIQQSLGCRNIHRQSSRHDKRLTIFRSSRTPGMQWIKKTNCSSRCHN